MPSEPGFGVNGVDEFAPNLGGDYAHRYIGPYLGQLWSMTARVSVIDRKKRGHRPRLQRI